MTEGEGLSPSLDLERLDRECRRLCQRYIDEVVLPLGLCPWAAPALRQGSTQMSVITDEISQGADSRSVSSAKHEVSISASAKQVDSALAECARDDRIDLVLVVLPRFRGDRFALDGFLREVRHVHEGAEASFAMAAFHPVAPAHVDDPERLIPFLRRSPDPLIQAVRSSVLERIEPMRGSGTSFADVEALLQGLLDPKPAEPLRRRIARANLDAVSDYGIERVDGILSEIAQDRARTYRGLGLPASPWELP